MAKSEAKPATEARAEAGGEGPAELYHAAIVEAARRACGSGRLDNPDASVSVDNPLCGDRVSIDVHVAGGRLRGVAHRVRGCLLCEAAASIIATNAIGETAQELALVSAALSDALADALANASANGFTDGSIGWQDLEVFAPVARHRSRHRCVTLAFEALAAAMAQAGKGG